MFKKILIPIDGSEVAHKAVETAQDLAEKYLSEVVLLYVLTPLLVGKFVITEEFQKNPDPEEFELFKPALKIFRENKIKVKPRIETGNTADRIVSIAEEEQADLIVIGSRGLSGITSFFLGSVSKQVVDDAPCTVVVVK